MISQEFQKKLMNVDDTTMYLGLSVNTIRSWVRRRCVPYVKINGALRFDRKKIDSWIERNKVSAKNLMVKVLQKTKNAKKSFFKKVLKKIAEPKISE